MVINPVATVLFVSYNYLSMLALYNSLSKKKEPFVALQKNKVLMYVCGITPYDTTHLGHAFTYIFFDVLSRYLTFKGYKVTYTQNVTDVDDDILRKAKETNRNWKELGQFWTNKFVEDMKKLNVLPPTHYVKATDSIALMIRIIEVLIEKDFAYEKKENVYFEIDKFKDYGKLSGFSSEKMFILSKERGGNPDDKLKKNPLDFLLWQKSRLNEPIWKSPWGPPAGGGRPGWHIECSAMISEYLGNQIDIHGGGRDLIFPHHESEIAQTESYTKKKPFVKFWMHTGMLMYKGEKMAKSLGNLVMVSDLLKNYTPNEIRWVLISHHYRKPWEFEETELNFARTCLSKISNLLKGIRNKGIKIKDNQNINEFTIFMDDDMDTPGLVKYLIKLTAAITNESDKPQKILMLQSLSIMLNILGFT